MQSAVREESYGSVRTFWLDADLVVSRLRRRAADLGRNPAVRRVILFGSLAEGRAVPGSDADILVVLDDDNRSASDRIPEFSAFFSDIGVPVDVFPYSERGLGNPVAAHALSRGIILYSRG